MILKSNIFYYLFFCFNDTATTEIYTLSLHDALPIWVRAVEWGETLMRWLSLMLNFNQFLPGMESRNTWFNQVVILTLQMRRQLPKKTQSTNINPPRFNLCLSIDIFRSEERPFCAPRIVLVGFHKCGTTDSSKWFQNERFSYRNADFFLDKIGSLCPQDFFEIRSKIFVRYV